MISFLAKEIELSGHTLYCRNIALEDVVLFYEDTEKMIVEFHVIWMTCYMTCSAFQGRQQSHAHELQSLQLRSQQESLEASRHIEEARRRAAEATQSAAQAIAAARGEATSSLQESTQRLISTQTAAANATAEAARQLAEVGVIFVHQRA